jgi:hypothetical protein
MGRGLNTASILILDDDPVSLSLLEKYIAGIPSHYVHRSRGGFDGLDRASVGPGASGLALTWHDWDTGFTPPAPNLPTGGFACDDGDYPGGQ